MADQRRKSHCMPLSIADAITARRWMDHGMTAQQAAFYLGTSVSRVENAVHRERARRAELAARVRFERAANAAELEAVAGHREDITAPSLDGEINQTMADLLRVPLSTRSAGEGESPKRPCRTGKEKARTRSD